MSGQPLSPHWPRRRWFRPWEPLICQADRLPWPCPPEHAMRQVGLSYFADLPRPWGLADPAAPAGRWMRGRR